MDKDQNPEQHLPDDEAKKAPVIAPAKTPDQRAEVRDDDDSTGFHYRDWASI